MPNYNKVILIGHLTRDPEMRYSGGGDAVVGCGLAVNTKRGQGKEDEVCFIDFAAFGKQAESLAKYTKKGAAILIEGRLRLEQWDDKATGARRSKHTIAVSSWTFAGGKPEAQDADPAPVTRRATPATQAPATAPEHDDVPF